MFLVGFFFLVLVLFIVDIFDILLCLLGLGKFVEVIFICIVFEGVGTILLIVLSIGVVVECWYENNIKDEDVVKIDGYICNIEMLFIVFIVVGEGK